MTIEIRSQARRMILGCLCAVAATASACGDGRGVPTSPSPSAAASSPSATAPDVQRPESVVVARSLSGSSPNRSLLLTKTCDAFNHCTVVTSEAGPIPVGTEALYAGPLLEQRTTSAVVTHDAERRYSHRELLTQLQNGTGHVRIHQRDGRVGRVPCQPQSHFRLRDESGRCVHVEWTGTASLVASETQRLGLIRQVEFRIAGSSPGHQPGWFDPDRCAHAVHFGTGR